MKKRLLTVLVMIAMVLSLAACGNNGGEASVDTTPVTESSILVSSTVISDSTETEAEPVVTEKYFLVQDVFTITLDEVKYTVVTGTSVGGTIYVDDTLVFEADGERIETKVVSFETIQGEHPTLASENENIAVWVDKYFGDTIQAGDKLVDETVK